MPIDRLVCSCTHAFSGSINQSDSHSHPLGGMKYSFFSLRLPVMSENLWRPTSPVVPHFPNILAWFSYCKKQKGTMVQFQMRARSGTRNQNKVNNVLSSACNFCLPSVCPTFDIYLNERTSSANTLKVPSEKELNFFSCADKPSHMLTRI